MQQIDIHEDLKEKAIFLAEYAATLEAVGAQTLRIHHCTKRIAKSFGYWCNMVMLPNSVSITLHNENREHVYTYVKKIPEMGLNFNINMKLSHLSWLAADKGFSLSELEERFVKIVKEPRESRWTVLILVAFANAAFCRLFDGNYTSIAIVWVATFVGFFIRQELLKRHWHVLAVFTICSFVSTMIGATDYLFFHGGTEDMSIGTSMLYLVPGVPIINGVMDMIDNHIINGVARLLKAFMLVVCIAVGLTFTVILLEVNPVTVTKVVYPNVLLAAVKDGLFATIAGLGFAIISNPPRKALLITAILACVGHGIRYFLMHHSAFMLDQVTASSIAGLAIGLLAIPAAMKIHYPAEGFAFPALLPMVPGMFAYKAIRDLIGIVRTPDTTNDYVNLFFHNATLTILVMMGMVACCVIPIFVFHKQSYSVTRDE